MPCDYSRYPKDWKQIRARILERSEHRCEWCGKVNHSMITFTYRATLRGGVPYSFTTPEKKVVLAIAHLDHDITNNTDDNLAALCQWCHLGHDREQHVRNAARTRAAKRAAGTAPLP